MGYTLAARRIAWIIGAVSLLCAGAASAQPLTQNQVEDAVRRAVDAANARGINATISVVDREGNLLACVRMIDTVSTDGTGATRTVPTTSVVRGGGYGGLDEGPFFFFYDRPTDTQPLFVSANGGARVATSLTATSKAGTAAFLSTSGNAFTTRTAAYIVQFNFPPTKRLQPSGPLFGVQFSQLPNSDFNRLPLGLSADSGGVPLYDSAGECRGGIGVETNDTRTADTGTYGVDTQTVRGRASVEEQIALAGQGRGPNGFAPPTRIQADRVLIGGIRLPYAYARPPVAPAFAAGASAAFLTAEEGAGRLEILFAPRGAQASMFTQVPLTDPAGGPEVLLNGLRGATVDGFHAGGALVTLDGVVNDPDGGGPIVGQQLTAADVQRALFQAHQLNVRLRAMIRRDRPLICQVNVTVVDTDGNIVGYYRSLDAPVFGMDVSAQKARSALFLSRPDCGAVLASVEPDHLLDPNGMGGTNLFSKYVTESANNGLMLDGGVAYGVRTIGFISRTNLPDAIPRVRGGATPRGPLGSFGPLPAGAIPNRFSVFNTGMQTDIFITNLVRFLLTYGPGGGAGEAASLAAFVANRTGDRPLGTSPLTPLTPPAGFAGDPFGFEFPSPGRVSRGAAVNGGDVDEPPPLGFPGRSLANGLQIFSGGVPLYKLDATTGMAVLVGGIGTSGDGIEQDDMVSFAGAGGFVASGSAGDFQQMGSNVMRADFISVGPFFLRLPYVKFPRAPFTGR